MSTGYRLHDVPFNLLILQYGKSIVDQYWWVRRLEVGAEVWWWLLHIYCCHLKLEHGVLIGIYMYKINRWSQLIMVEIKNVSENFKIHSSLFFYRKNNI